MRAARAWLWWPVAITVVWLDRKVNKTPDSSRGRQLLPLILATPRRAFQRKYALVMVLTKDVEVQRWESLVCQRCENGEVSWEKWSEKDKSCCVTCQVISATDDGKRLSSDFFFEAEAHLFLTLFGSHLSRCRRSTGVLSQAGLVAAGIVGYM